MPLGPRALLTDSATIRAAMMLACWASLPRERLAPSRSIRTGVPASCVDNLKQSSLYCGTVEKALEYKSYATSLASSQNWIKNEGNEADGLPCDRGLVVWTSVGCGGGRPDFLRRISTIARAATAAMATKSTMAPTYGGVGDGAAAK